MIRKDGEMRKICEVWESDTGETVFKFDAFYCDDKVIEMLSRIEADSKKVKLIVNKKGNIEKDE